MNEKETEQEIAAWCSTYGIITAQRLLERYNISLDTDDLLQTLKTPGSFYHCLLRVPMRNVFNGIIMQQVQDYQVYVQKLFIDYLLSGPNEKEEGAPGEPIREDLEIMRQNLESMNDSFHVTELDQEALIVKSQQSLKAIADGWNEKLNISNKTIKNALIPLDLVKTDAKLKQALVSLIGRYDFQNDNSEKKGWWDKFNKLLNIEEDQAVKEIFLNEIRELSAYVAETETALHEFNNEIEQMSRYLRQFRLEFYNFIISVKDLLALLPDYQIDGTQDLDNRETLFFDKSLGEEVEK